MAKDSVQTNVPETPQTGTSIPWWISTIVVVGAILTVAGAVISKVAPMMLASGGSMTDVARVYADYMFARNVSLAVMVLLLLVLRARRMLAGFMVLIALIQLVDVIDDLTRGAFMLVPGLLVFAIVFLIGAWRLFGQTIWHANAWRDPEH